MTNQAWISQIADVEERISMAESELSELTPEKYLAVLNHIQHLEDQAKLPEAVGSTSTYMRGPGGAEILVVVRGVSIDQAWEDMRVFVTERIKEGYKPVVKYPEGSKTASGSSPAGGATTSEPKNAPISGIPANDGFYDAETISVSVNDGKTSFRIKGGIFKQYGVICWPETLAAAGFDPDHPPKDLSGYKAYYINNENGKPKKVVALVKVG